jgi:biopolymer transport protein ExbD
MSAQIHHGLQTMFRHKKKKTSDEMSLQITSMADIFTIILVFLLKTTASGINTVAPNGASLPVAKGKEIIQDTLKMEINRDFVTIDDKTVLNLNQFEIPITELQAGGMSQSVYQAFMNKRRSNQEVASNSTLLVLADENTPYSTLKSVLASAANTGFVDLQLVVVEDN